jgi:hypothetical protein
MTIAASGSKVGRRTGILIFCLTGIMIAGSACGTDAPIVQPGYGRIRSPLGSAVLSLDSLPQLVALRQDYGYNYTAICVFAETVQTYALPDLRPESFRNRMHLRRIRDSRNTSVMEEEYAYADGVVTGVVIKQADHAYFRSFRLDANHVPLTMRLKQGVLSIFEVDNKETSGDALSMGCETYTVLFHFDAAKVKSIDFFNANLD